MASLLDTVKNKSPLTYQNGQLVQESAEGIQNLASAAGQAPPTNPLQAATIGANADSTKMAGTPNQSQSALRIAIQGQNNLGTQQREAQPNKQTSAETQLQAQKAEHLAGLAGLQGRVQQLVNQRLTGTNPAAQIPQLNQTALAQQIPDAGAQAAISPILTRAVQGQATPQELDAMVKIAYPDTYAGMTPAERVQKAQALVTATTASQTDQAAAALSGAIKSDVSFADFDQPALHALGFDSITDLADTLGMPQDQVAKMKPSELAQQIGNLQRKEFDRVAALKSRAADPSLSEADRQQAMQDLRAEGASGEAGIENQVQNLQKQVANADQIHFAGQNYSVEDLLKSDNMQAQIKNYLENPESAATLKAKEPEFATWIDQNASALKDKVAGVSKQLQDSAALQTANQQVAQLSGANPNEQYNTIPDEVMKQLYPDWGQVTGTKYTPPPIADLFKSKNYTQQTKQSLSKAMVDLADINPSLAATLAKMTPQQLEKSGLTNPDKLQAYLQHTQLVNSIATMPDSQMFQTLFPDLPNATPDKIQDLINQEFLAKQLDANYKPSKLVTLLDANHDGKLDPSATVRQLISNKLGPELPPARASHANIGAVTDLSSDYENRIQQNQAYQELSPYIAGNKLTPDSLIKAVKAGVDSDTIQSAMGSKLLHGMTTQAQNSILNQLAWRDMTPAFKAAGLGSLPEADAATVSPDSFKSGIELYTKLQAALEAVPDGSVAKSKIQNMMNKVQDTTPDQSPIGAFMYKNKVQGGQAMNLFREANDKYNALYEQKKNGENVSDMEYSAAKKDRDRAASYMTTVNPLFKIDQNLQHDSWSEWNK